MKIIMKKLTDYYVLITENIVDEVIEYFRLHQNKKYLIGKYFLFRYDDKESYYTRPTEPQLRTKLKWSELKRFIENSPTREKYRSVQNSVKGYKTALIKESLKIKGLERTNDLLVQSNSELNNKLKWANIKITSLEDSYEKEKESKKSFLDANLNLSKLYETEYHKNTNLHNELLEAEKTIESLKKDNVTWQKLNDSNLEDLKECTTKLHELGYFEYWCDDLNTELQQKSQQLNLYKYCFWSALLGWTLGSIIYYFIL